MNFFENTWNGIADSVQNLLGNADQLFFTIVKAALTILLAKLLIRLINKIISKALTNKAKKHPGSTYEKKQNTLITLFHSITKYAVYFFMVVILLEIIGLGKTVSSVIATAGIGGVAIGLGAQSLISDIVAGFFNLFEDTFAVGDYINLPDLGLSGTVEALSLRTTRLTLANGQTAIVTNGKLGTIVNFTRSGYKLILNYDIAPDEDDARAEKVLTDTVTAYIEEKHYEPLSVSYLGIAAFSPAGKTLRIVAVVPPLQQWQAELDLNKAVLDAFAAAGIRRPAYRDVIGMEPVGK